MENFKPVDNWPLLCCRVRSEILRGSSRIPRLHEYCARTGELADKTLAGCKIADNTTGRNTLQHVLAVPCNKMTVVDDILFSLAKLPGYQ